MNTQPLTNRRSPAPPPGDEADGVGQLDDPRAAALTAAFLAPLKPVTRTALCVAYGLAPQSLERALALLDAMPGADTATLAQRRDHLLAAGWQP